MITLFRHYRYIPYQYIKHGLYLKSYTDDVCDYLPPELMLRFAEALNPADSLRNVSDKERFCRTMQAHNFPVVPTLFTIHRNASIRAASGKEISFAEFVSTAQESQNAELFVKPADGWGGRGSLRLTANQGHLRKENGKLLDERTLLHRLFSKPSDTYLVQPVIRQHELLSRMNPSSVNTVRIDTLVRGNDVVNNAALLRVGNGTTHTDSFSTGGSIIKIDLETGRLIGNAKTKAKYGRMCWKTHPLTGFHFEGVVLPFWAELRDLVCSAALCLRPLGCLGWDVAIQETGPLLIETNHLYSKFMQQEACGGLRSTPMGRQITGGLR